MSRTDFLLALACGGAWAARPLINGLHMSPDSGHYLFHALELVAEGRLSLEPLWPPLYPMLIAAFMPVLKYPAQCAAALTALTVVAQFLVWAFFVRTQFKSPAARALFVLFFISTPSLDYTSKIALSGGLFTVFFILNGLFVTRHIQTQSRWDFFLAAIFASCAALTRYIGYSAILLFSMYAFLCTLGDLRRKQARQIPQRILAVAIAGLPSLTYLIRNQLAFATLHGSRSASSLALADVFKDTQNLVVKNGWEPRIALFAAAVILLVLFTISDCREKHKTPAALSAWYMLLLGGCYSLLVVYAQVHVAMDRVHVRMLLPAFACLQMLVVLTASIPASKRRPKKLLYTSRAVLIGGSLLLTVLESGALIHHVIPERSHSSLFTNAGFQNDPACRELGTFLGSELQTHREISVAVLPYRSNRPHMAGALFYHRQLFQSARLKRISYEAVQDHAFSVHGQAEAGPVKLHFRSLPVIHQDEDLLSALHDIQKHDQGKQVLLVVFKNNRSGAGGRLYRFLDNPMAVRLALQTRKYLVYEALTSRSQVRRKIIPADPSGRARGIMVDAGDLSRIPQNKVTIHVNGMPVDPSPHDGANIYGLRPENELQEQSVEIQSDAAVLADFGLDVFDVGEPVNLSFSEPADIRYGGLFDRQPKSRERTNSFRLSATTRLHIPTPLWENACFAAEIYLAHQVGPGKSTRLQVFQHDCLLQEQVLSDGKQAIGVLFPTGQCTRDETPVVLKCFSAINQVTDPHGAYLGLQVTRVEPDKRYSIDIGTPGDLPWLGKGFYGREKDGGNSQKHFRWTMGDAVIRVVPSTTRTNELPISLVYLTDSGPYLQTGRQPVLKVGDVVLSPVSRSSENQSETHVSRFSVPANLASGAVLRVHILTDTWIPAKTLEGSNDKRTLGIKLHQIQIGD